MKYVKVYPIDNFEELRKRFLAEVEIRQVADKIYGDYWGGAKYSIKDARVESKSDAYKSIFKEMVGKAVNDYCLEWGCSRWSLHSIWIHKYDVGAKYIHHTHHLSNMSGVIHLSLLDERDHTYIQGLDISIKEGDVVLFPSMHPHESKETNAEKIVVSFNWNMHGDHNVSPISW